MRLRWTLAILLVSSPAWAHGSVHAFASTPQHSWAAGDAGLILRSDDAGLTWQPCPPPAPDVDLYALHAADEVVTFFGGRGIPGHPAGAGNAVIYQTTDAGKSFSAIYPAQAGWLYGGALAGRSWTVFGQACHVAPSGVWTSDSAGKAWEPVHSTTRGPLLAGAFQRPQLGHLVGPDQRVVRLEALRTLVEAPLPPVPATLRAVAFGDQYAWWAVGDNSTVVTGGVDSGRWRQVAIPMPPRARRLADFCALAAASPSEVWVGGGLTALLYHTTDAGKTWTPRPAPGPGPLRTLSYHPSGVLLAGGDSGRIWRSADRGASWKLVHGPPSLDVLFVLTPGDMGLWPAIAAHAAAGLDVAVVWASRPPDDGLTDPDQPLRAAAARAGAGGALVLHDFLSPATAGDPDSLNPRDVRLAWRQLIEADPDPELLLQLAAAIRLYRPLVLAIASDDPQAAGAQLEAAMMSRLARAAQAQPGDVLDSIGLPAFTAQRLFVADPLNARWRLPWASAAPAPSGRGTPMAASYFIAGRNEPLELLTQRAIWQLPWLGLTDRPAARCLYRCDRVQSPALFTAGLRSQVLRLTEPSPDQARLAASIDLHARPAAALAFLAGAADAEPTALLAADRALLGWWSLLQAARLSQANPLLATALRHGQRHPLYQKAAVTSMAIAASDEWRALLPRKDRAKPLTAQAAATLADQLARWPAWAVTGEGRFLHSRLLAAAGRTEPARLALRRLVDGPSYPRPWRELAVAELAVQSGKTADTDLGRAAHALDAKAPLRLDGRLDEDFWKRAFTYRLNPIAPATRAATRPAAPSPAGTLQAARVNDALALAVRLPASHEWRLTVALDVDRDAWTQTLLTFDTAGGQTVRVECRGGPSAGRPGDQFPFRLDRQLPQDDKDPGHYVFELLLPLENLGIRGEGPGVWRFQAMAVGLRDLAPDAQVQACLWFQPQVDSVLSPHRYGLLFVPPGAPGK